MPTPANEVKVTLLEEGTNTVNGNMGEATPAEQDAATTSAFESAYGRVIRRAFAPHELPSLIEAVFSSKDEGNTIRCLLRDDAQTFIDVMDEALDGPDLSPGTRKKCLRFLYRTCGRHALLPRALKIPICYDRTVAPLHGGGFADVWKGEHGGRDVAVKVLRTYLNSDLQKIIGKFCKEVVTWKTLRHPNILPLIGVMMSETQFAMVSDWMANGNINQFVRAHPDANRLELLEDTTKGLIYIHGQGMIHGDLKGANILDDQYSHARLADFGLLTIISDPANLFCSSSYTQGGTARWMSPELIAPQRFGLEKSRPTKSSDCYALGMVIYETISGNLPFHKDTDLTVFTKVLEGGRPPRGVRFTEGLWKMLELCWTSQPNNRPSIEDVLLRLVIVSNLPAPPSPRVDEAMDDDFEYSFDHSSPASSDGLPSRGSESRSRASSVSSHSHPHFPSSPPIQGYQSLRFDSPHWNTALLPANKPSSPSQKPPSPPSLVIPDASPFMNAENLHTRAPLINVPQGDGGVMNDPQLHIVPATSASGRVPKIPFINIPVETSTPPTWNTEAAPQNISFDTRINSDFNNSQSNTLDHHLVPQQPRSRSKSDTSTRPPLWDVSFDPSSNNGTSVNLNDILPPATPQSQGQNSFPTDAYQNSQLLRPDMPFTGVSYPPSAHLDSIARTAAGNLNTVKQQPLHPTEAVPRIHPGDHRRSSRGSRDRGIGGTGLRILPSSFRPNPYPGPSASPLLTFDPLPSIHSLPPPIGMGRGRPASMPTYGASSYGTPPGGIGELGQQQLNSGSNLSDMGSTSNGESIPGINSWYSEDSSSSLRTKVATPVRGPHLSQPDHSKPQATFLTKLYALLERPENHHMIRWDPSGEYIIIEKPKQLALHVLPLVYRQSHFTSFSRQLEIHGFTPGVDLQDDPTIDDPDASTWFHLTLTRYAPLEFVADFGRRVFLRMLEREDPNFVPPNTAHAGAPLEFNSKFASGVSLSKKRPRDDDDPIGREAKREKHQDGHFFADSDEEMKLEDDDDETSPAPKDTIPPTTRQVSARLLCPNLPQEVTDDALSVPSKHPQPQGQISSSADAYQSGFSNHFPQPGLLNHHSPADKSQMDSQFLSPDMALTATSLRRARSDSGRVPRPEGGISYPPSAHANFIARTATENLSTVKQQFLHPTEAVPTIHRGHHRRVSSGSRDRGIGLIRLILGVD